MLVRGDEREAAPVKGGREGGGGPHVRVETRGAARLEVAVVEEDGDDRRRRGGDPARTLPARGVPSDGDGIRGRRGGVRRGWCRGGRASRRRGLREEARPRWWGGAGEGAGVGARGGAVTRVGGASAPDPHRIVGWGRGDRAGGEWEIGWVARVPGGVIQGAWGGPPRGLDAQLGRMAQGEGGFAFLFFGFYFPFISFLFSFSFLFYYSFVKYQSCT